MPFIQEPVLTGTWPFASPERRTLRSIDIRFSSWYVALFLSDIVSHRRLLFWMRSNFEPNFPIDPQLQFERLLDCGEVARLLHLHPKTVERMAREGRLPAFKVGRRWLFRTTHIDQWVSSLVHSTPASVLRGIGETP